MSAQNDNILIVPSRNILLTEARETMRVNVRSRFLLFTPHANENHPATKVLVVIRCVLTPPLQVGFTVGRHQIGYLFQCVRRFGIPR
jgi:hypothetical protein